MTCPVMTKDGYEIVCTNTFQEVFTHFFVT
jgi:hypothetical protein